MRRGKWYNNYNDIKSKTDWQQTKYVAYAKKILEKWVNVGKRYQVKRSVPVLVNVPRRITRLIIQSKRVNVGKRYNRKIYSAKLVNVGKKYLRKPSTSKRVNVPKRIQRKVYTSKFVNVSKNYVRKVTSSKLINVRRRYERKIKGSSLVNVFVSYRLLKKTVSKEINLALSYYPKRDYTALKVNSLFTYQIPDMSRFPVYVPENVEEEI